MQLRWLESRDRRGTVVPVHANNGTNLTSSLDVYPLLIAIDRMSKSPVSVGMLLNSGHVL